MNQYLLTRVKNALKLQYYCMNDTWLTDCIEYYLEDHNNPTQDEIITFVISQWLLCDLREINNENGCLPKNLANQRCTTLPGKYVLQMDKMYDISKSKYKQLEEIRNVSSENVKTTETEEEKQGDKYQAPSKRMLELYLTDGVQDIIAIEYQPIPKLKDTLFPGFKLLIKGPVVCRKGVILLEEKNVCEVGGEVESLLIPNALENVLARALNLKENPDPYNDMIVAKERERQEKASVKTPSLLEDDFEIDSEVIDQIEKQIEEQTSSVNKINIVNKPIYTEPNYQPQSRSSINNFQRQSTFINETPNSSIISKNQQLDSNSNLSTRTNKIQTPMDKFLTQKRDTNFEQQSSCSKVLEDLSMSRHASTMSNTSTTKKHTSILNLNQDGNEFPMENEIYDLAEESSSFFPPTQSNQPIKISTVSHNKTPCIQNEINNQTTSFKNEKLKQNNISPRSILKKPSSDVNGKNTSWKFPSPLQSTNHVKITGNSTAEFPDDDFQLDTMNTNDYNNYCNTSNKSNLSNQKFSQTSAGGLSVSNMNQNNECSSVLYSAKGFTDDSNENQSQEYDSFSHMKNEFDNDFDFEFENNMNMASTLPIDQKQNNITNSKIEKVKNSTVTSEIQFDPISTANTTGTKRSANTPPGSDVRNKIRCTENTPKSDAANTQDTVEDFECKSPIKIEDYIPIILELMHEVLEYELTAEPHQTTVRGKVTNIVKLNLLKSEKGPYFFLEGTITDYTASMDIIFSPQVLDQIIGYTAQEFSLKRKQSKTDPTIKDLLREELKRAQQVLRVMDAIMDLEMIANKKPMIIKIREMTEDQKAFMDYRVESFRK